MSLTAQRLRRMGRHIPPPAVPVMEQPPGRVHETGCALCDATPPPSFMATHDDPLLMDTTLDQKPRKGRHRRQR